MTRDGAASRFVVIRDGAGVPDQRPFGVRDQVARYGQIARGDLFLLELKAPYIGDVESSAIEDI